MKKMVRRKREVSQDWDLGIRIEVGGLVGFCEKRRDELGLTQKELAGRLGKTGAWLSMMERGGGLMVSDLELLLKELGVKEVVLFL